MLVMFAGMLAFDVLDRLTGEWSVTNSDWFQGFYAAVIQVWFRVVRRGFARGRSYAAVIQVFFEGGLG